MKDTETLNIMKKSDISEEKSSSGGIFTIMRVTSLNLIGFEGRWSSCAVLFW